MKKPPEERPRTEKETDKAGAVSDSNKRVSPQSLVQKAYEKLSSKLDEGDSKAIDDLIKLLKAQKDLGGEENDVTEIKVRWEQNGDKSSSEE